MGRARGRGVGVAAMTTAWMTAETMSSTWGRSTSPLMKRRGRPPPWGVQAAALVGSRVAGLRAPPPQAPPPHPRQLVGVGAVAEGWWRGGGRAEGRESTGTPPGPPLCGSVATGTPPGPPLCGRPSPTWTAVRKGRRTTPPRPTYRGMGGAGEGGGSSSSNGGKHRPHRLRISSIIYARRRGSSFPPHSSTTPLPDGLGAGKADLYYVPPPLPLLQLHPYPPPPPPLEAAASAGLVAVPTPVEYPLLPCRLPV